MVFLIMTDTGSSDQAKGEIDVIAARGHHQIDRGQLRGMSRAVLRRSIASLLLRLGHVPVVLFQPGVAAAAQRAAQPHCRQRARRLRVARSRPTQNECLLC